MPAASHGLYLALSSAFPCLCVVVASVRCGKHTDWNRVNAAASAPEAEPLAATKSKDGGSASHTTCPPRSSRRGIGQTWLGPDAFGMGGGFSGGGGGTGFRTHGDPGRGALRTSVRFPWTTEPCVMLATMRSAEALPTKL